MHSVAMIGAEILPVPPVRGGGPERLILELSRALSSAYRPTIFSRRVPEIDSMAKPAEESTCFRWIKHGNLERKLFANRLTWSSMYYAWPYVTRLIRELSRTHWDIIHIHNRPQFVPRIRKAAQMAKIVLHLHNEYLSSRSKRPLQEEFVKKIVDNCDVIITCSDFVRRKIIGELPMAEGKVNAILNGVNIEQFRPKWLAPDIWESARRKYRLQDKKVILFVGRLTYDKGAHLLVEAMKTVLDHVDNAMLLIVGSSFYWEQAQTPYMKKLKEQVGSFEDSIRFTGQVSSDEVANLYILSDVFAFPVEWDDPSPLVVYEALAAGLPVVTARRGGIPEILGKDGECGFYIEKSDAWSLSQLLIRLLSDESMANKLGRNGRRRAEALFTWQCMARKMETVYGSVLEQ